MDIVLRMALRVAMWSPKHMCTHSIQHACAQNHTQQSTWLLPQVLGTMYLSQAIFGKQTKLGLKIPPQGWCFCGILSHVSSTLPTGIYWIQKSITWALDPTRRKQKYCLLSTEEATSCTCANVGTWRLCSQPALKKSQNLLRMLVPFASGAS